MFPNCMVFRNLCVICSCAQVAIWIVELLFFNMIYIFFWGGCLFILFKSAELLRKLDKCMIQK
jgi:hypothetical protein